MPTKLKIKIDDHASLRWELDNIFASATQKQIAEWALCMGTHIMQIASPEYLENEVVTNGYAINRLWQDGKARMHEVRQASFKIHQLAKACEDQKIKLALRVVGHAVATGHMKEHGMVSSDYAIKLMNVLYVGNGDAVTGERLWQIEKLKATVSQNNRHHKTHRNKV